MIASFQNYNLGYRVASLALSEATLLDLALNGLDTLFVYGGKIIFLPDNKEIEASEEALQGLLQCHEYDVFEISEDGKAYRYYSNEALDNAFMVTGKCNSSCIMCPASDCVRKAGKTMSLDALLAIIRHIPCDAEHLTITGGEPFLLGEDIFPFLNALRSKFCRTDFLLLTNGRAFGLKGYAERFYGVMPSHMVVGIPVHGYDAPSHDFVTRVPGSFHQTITGIKNLIQLGVRVELRVVLSKVSAKYVDRIARLIVEELPSVYCIRFIGLEMLGNAARNSNDVWIAYPEAFRLSRKAIAVLLQHGIDVGLYGFPLCAVDTWAWGICENGITDYKVRYADECGDCKVKDACGGVFAGSLRYARGDFKAVTVE